MWRRFAVRKTGDRVHQLTAVVAELRCFEVEHHHLFLSKAHGFGHTFAQTAFVFRRRFKPVDHQLYAVILIAVELHALHNLAQFAVDTHIQIAFASQTLEQFLVMALAVFHQRSQQINFAVFEFIEYELHYFFFGIFHHFGARFVAARLAYAGI